MRDRPLARAGFEPLPFSSFAAGCAFSIQVRAGPWVPQLSCAKVSG
jgi:hypothetical protein